MDLNWDRLCQAEQDFLQLYPGGFEHPEIAKLGKKHKVTAMCDAAQAAFGPEAFDDPLSVVQEMSRQISRSSMVSLFEKPKFRDYVATLTPKEAEPLAQGLHDFLHGPRQAGFERMLEQLRTVKLGKWTLLTILPNYYHPDSEVFVKPSVAKGVVAEFGLPDLVYKPQPGWSFYEGYREAVLAMKAELDPSLSPSNAAFCGFLMMSLPVGGQKLR